MSLDQIQLAGIFVEVLLHKFISVQIKQKFANEPFLHMQKFSFTEANMNVHSFERAQFVTAAFRFPGKMSMSR